jgi:hypothetical protein
MRFSLKVAETSEEFDDQYEDWRIAYHGTQA